MFLKSICKTDVVTADRNATLSAVSFLMQQGHVGSVVITESFNGKKVPCGIITDRDVALAMGSSSKPQELKVENLMRSHPVTAKVNDDIFDVIEKMRVNGIKRIPVLDKDGSLFGIVCADDLLSVMGEEINSLATITELQIRKEEGVRMPVERNVQY